MVVAQTGCGVANEKGVTSTQSSLITEAHLGVNQLVDQLQSRIFFRIVAKIIK